MPTAHVITLYVHPRQGPISPMKIDFDQIFEDTARGAETTDNAVIRLIREKFGTVQPESNRPGIQFLTGHFAMLSQHNVGVGLLFEGAIESQGSETDHARQLEERLRQLGNELSQERNRARMLEQGKVSMESQIRDLQQQAIDLRGHADANLREAEIRGRERDQLQQTADDQSREIGALKVEIDRLKNQPSAAPRPAGNSQEALRLQSDLLRSQETERQLNDTIKEREKRIAELEQTIRRLSGQDTSGPSAIGPILPP